MTPTWIEMNFPIYWINSNMSETTQEPLGRQVFDRLRSEYETGWLSNVYVKPSSYAAMSGMRSIVVFGAEGSGKTALALTLVQEALQQDAAAPLVIDWQPAFPDLSQPQDALVHAFFNQAMAASALALCRHIGQAPDRLKAAPRWVQTTAAWFVHRYLVDLDYTLSRLEEEVTPEGMTLLEQIAGQAPANVLSDQATIAQLLAELVRCLQRLGRGGVWVMIAGLDAWVQANESATVRVFKALLSTLALFEEPGFSIKLFAPAQIKAPLLASSGVMRRRLDDFVLDWSSVQLNEMVYRRLGAALLGAGQHVSLQDLCLSPETVQWVEKYGGNSPRGWLELSGKVLDEFLSCGGQQPLTEEQCTALLQRNPPRLRLDLTGDLVFLGYSPVTNIQPAAYRLLKYLYTHPSRRCTRQELYYRGYRGLDHEPRHSTDAGYEVPAAWGGTLETTLSRLRQAIEPDPDEPVYLVTERGKGFLHLENSW